MNTEATKEAPVSLKSIVESVTLEHAGRTYQAGPGLEFFIFGKQQTAGSKSAIVYKCKTTGKMRAAITSGKNKEDREKNASWRSIIQAAATACADPLPDVCASIWESPLYFAVEYTIPRPNGHFKKDGVSLSTDGKRKPWPTVKPDVLKLTRAVEDALNDLIYKDDAAIVIEHISKHYGTRHVTKVTIRPILSCVSPFKFLLDTLAD